MIAFIGDIHRSFTALEHTLTLALSTGATTIIQCGDYWLYGDEVPPQPDDHPDMAQMAQATLESVCPPGIDLAEVDLRFIDGNHENFDLLNPDADEPVAVSENITYMPRGSRARLAGAELLFLGGASSIDKTWRTEGFDWWPGENITDEQTNRAVTAATDPGRPAVDILVTHETTTEAFDVLSEASSHACEKAGEPAGETNRAHLMTVRNAAAPRAHVHGHHHTRFAAPVADILDIGLNQETDDGSVAVLDTHGGGPDDWTWSIPVEQNTYASPDDDYTQPPEQYHSIEVQGLLEFDAVELPSPEVSLDTYDEPVTAATIESITAHRMVLQRTIGRGYGFGLRRPLAARAITQRITAERSEGTEGTDASAQHRAAEQLTQWITDDDTDTLAIHLLDPRGEFDEYRELSPIIELWGTTQIRQWATHAARHHRN